MGFQVNVLDSLLALEERSAKRKPSLDLPPALRRALQNSVRICFFRNSYTTKFKPEFNKIRSRDI